MQQLRQFFTKASLKQQPWTFVGLAVMLLFIFLRVWRISFPGETVFDEVYFPKMAHQYLSGESFFDIHPPLGKLIIAVGEMLFGNTQLGWRIMPLLAGIATIPVAYWTSLQVFGDKRVGFITALLIALDGLFIVYSRTGLMDGFLILFGLAAFGFAFVFRRRRVEGESAWLPLILTGLFAGLALAIKWIGAGFLPVVGLITLVTLLVTKERKADVPDYLIWAVSMIVLPFMLYTVPFLANWQTDFWHQFIVWHQQSWGYNINLDATHPYSSKWWSWPFLVRPIWFYYKNVDGNIFGVDAIGNPLVWWGSTLAVVYTLMVLVYSFVTRKRESAAIVNQKYLLPLLAVTIGWAAFYVPWIKVGRVLFLYHYFGSYLFALLLAGFWIGQAVSSGKYLRYVIIALLAAFTVVGLCFAPIWIAYPIPQAWFDRLMWFTSWI